MNNLALTLLVLAIGAVLLTSAQVPDLSNYPFRASLLDDRDQGQYYALYWNFSLQAGTIHFAVNVSTTGWVGLGISPNGQMPGSDVVIAWVADDGTPYVTDRFADARSLPPYDSSQDWFVVSGVEENGFTILEFSRNLTTCDNRDLEIKADTSRVVWSFQANDPTDPLGNTATFHDRQGSFSLNLLGGLVDPPPDPVDAMSFTVGVSDVTIPSNRGTTYWCASTRLPAEIIDQKRFITRYTPSITPNGRAYVHHMLVYLCTLEDPATVGESAPCDQVSDRVSECRSELLVAAWAIGGEDFIYPENIAYPIGGPNSEMFAVVEIHYDNPGLDTGVVDSSGVEFFYTSMAPEHEAGILFIGHSVTPGMIIPPNTNNYTIAGLCPGVCTDAYLPPDGIHIIGNALHTHLAGHGLTLRHLRWNPECEVMEELEPIDQNLRYDFNYQQVTHLPHEFIVKPNDTLILECFYDTSNRSSLTLGGESTQEEMCLTFPIYYPRMPNALDNCVSFPQLGETALTPFVTKYGNNESIQNFLRGNVIGGFSALDWTQEGIVQDIEDVVLNNDVGTFCSSESGERFVSQFPNGLPEVGCAYQAPDKCNSQEAGTCCDIGGGAVHSVPHVISIVSMLWLCYILFH